MGMFDWVKNVPVEIEKCPMCESKLTGWQTKDTLRTLATIDFNNEKIESVHTACDGCGFFIRVQKWISGNQKQLRIEVTNTIFKNWNK